MASDVVNQHAREFGGRRSHNLFLSRIPYEPTLSTWRYPGDGTIVLLLGLVLSACQLVKYLRTANELCLSSHSRVDQYSRIRSDLLRGISLHPGMSVYVRVRNREYAVKHSTFSRRGVFFLVVHSRRSITIYMSGAKIPQIPCLFVSFAPERVELHGFTTRQC